MNKKKKMGRPRICNAKTTGMTIKMSPLEKEALQTLANKAGMTLGAYILEPHRKRMEKK